MAQRIQIPFSFNFPSGGNLVPAATVSVAVYIRNLDGSQGSSAAVFQSQSGSSQYSSMQTDSGGNVPGWVNEGTYKIVAAASGGFGGGSINFDALYGGGTALIAANAVDLPQLSTAVQASLVPSGTILDHAGTAAPAGFLACDGSVVSQITYAALFAAIGTGWNTGGEAGGSFRLPNLIGLTTVGRGTAAWGTVRTLGQYGLPSGGVLLGEEEHITSIGETPLHNHGGATGGGLTSGGTDADFPDHAHSGGTTSALAASYAPISNNGWANLSAAGGSLHYAAGSNEGTVGYAFLQHSHSFNTGGASARHSHTITNLSIPALGIAIQGGGAAHNNMPPFAVVNKIIKY